MTILKRLHLLLTVMNMIEDNEWKQEYEIPTNFIRKLIDFLLE